ncbi:MAG: NADAR family protein [Chlamydiota bacterium]
MSTPLCQNCHIRPAFTGHPYCGRTCAGAAQAAATTTTTVAQATLCQLPGCRQPAFPGSPACSKSHLSALAGSQAHPQGCRCTAFAYPGSPACSQQSPALTRAAVTTAQVGLKCLVPSCQLPAISGYQVCSQEHQLTNQLTNIQQACASSLHKQKSQPTTSIAAVQTLARSKAGSSMDFYKLETNPTSYFLGNFYISENPIIFRGLTFKCSEGAYQFSRLLTSQNFLSYPPSIQNAIAALFQEADGEQSWQLMNKDLFISTLKDDTAHKAPILHNGATTSVNVVIMEEILRAKFAVGTTEWKLLQATGDTPLRETTAHGDKFWGVDTQGQGQNRLGQLLMQIRAETKPATTAAPTSSEPTQSWGAWAASFFK